VQFAPLYVAQQRGYYRSAGLDVRFIYGSSPNLLQLVAAGRDTFAVADGTDVIAAASQGLKVTYVATLYRTLPVALFSLTRSHIKTMSDLKGKSIGIPGRFGSTYAGLLAALHQAGISSHAVTIRSVGFSQDDNLVRGNVQSAVGYSNNDTVILQRHGYKLNVIDIGATTRLVGPGLIAGRTLIAQHPTVVKRFVQATMRGLADTIASPKAAFTISLRVPGLSTLRGTAAADQFAVLQRSISLWHDTATRSHGLGFIDPTQWNTSVSVMRAVGLARSRPSVSAISDERFVAGAPKR
jgi:NitT/TauT family transport system substrate-binding protein